MHKKESVLYAFVLISLLMLTVGGDLLVRGASHLALKFGISKLIVGLTIVAFGTSAPELAVSLEAIFENKVDIAIGNVVGSNIFNILAILGLSALVAPLLIDKKLISFDLPFLVLIGVVFYILAFDGTISTIDGLLLLVLLSFYLYKLIRSEKDSQNEQSASQNLLLLLAFIVLGVLLLVYGAKLLVFSSSEIARSFGVSELVIGLTIVAVGTSLPELATSVVATIKKEREIAVGNVIGSNIFNTLFIVGLSAVFASLDLKVADTLLSFDLIFLLFITLILYFVVFKMRKISRFVGGSFVAIYIFYIFLLF